MSSSGKLVCPATLSNGKKCNKEFDSPLALQKHILKDHS
jgi:hypothetical protein